ncbi:MAG: hypothetical protein DRO18_01105 [Thermoprotei archaeon]|nr:MAG: hypothetical protein DRO18_01105 [Thermoprotei archaeon]
MSKEVKYCRLDPLRRTRCRFEKQDFETCLLCQLSWIRGLLYRLVMDLEEFMGKSSHEVIERILRRNLTQEERELVNEMLNKGLSISEIVNKLKSRPQS